MGTVTLIRHDLDLTLNLIYDRSGNIEEAIIKYGNLPVPFIETGQCMFLPYTDICQFLQAEQDGYYPRISINGKIYPKLHHTDIGTDNYAHRSYFWHSICQVPLYGREPVYITPVYNTFTGTEGGIQYRGRVLQYVQEPALRVGDICGEDLATEDAVSFHPIKYSKLERAEQLSPDKTYWIRHHEII